MSGGGFDLPQQTAAEPLVKNPSLSRMSTDVFTRLNSGTFLHFSLPSQPTASRNMSGDLFIALRRHHPSWSLHFPSANADGQRKRGWGGARCRCCRSRGSAAVSVG